MFDSSVYIGHRDNTENVEAIINSIVDNTKDSYKWEGTEEGIVISINEGAGIIKNGDDIAAKVYELWKSGSLQDE